MPDFSNEDLLKQRQQLWGMVQGFRQAQVLLSCVELGVIEALNAGPATAFDVAQTIGADPRAELLLNAAGALDLLEKHAEIIKIDPLGELPGQVDANGERVNKCAHRQ